MKFHEDFLRETFAINDATIMAALLPVVASQTEGDDEAFETGIKDYLEKYAEHLDKMNQREFIVTLSQAAKISKARSGVA